VNVLGIETSCDETAAAVVADGRAVLSSVVFSQAALHRPYGGVVPEIASRSHLENLPGVIAEAVRAGPGWAGLDAVAVTYGPGLATSLLVGLAAAKGLALRLDRPLCAINHIEAHIYSVFLSADAPPFDAVCPFAALVVSGGHTCLLRVDGLGRYRLLGQTIDDAAGEAFDKGANLLGLGYPGGPAIDKASRGGRADYVSFPRGRQRREHARLPGLEADLCFSFSGLKTALLYYLKQHPLPAEGAGDGDRASLAASYQEAIVDALATRCDRAVAGMRALAVGGGVSLNRRLREELARLADRRGIRLLLAEPRYCADNAAMIAALAGAGQGLWGAAALAADAQPNLPTGV
jgi:N6-L-threonylcarbamoyladenine synthase